MWMWNRAWKWTLNGSVESLVVFDISSKSFSDPLFQFPFHCCHRMTTRNVKNDAKFPIEFYPFFKEWRKKIWIKFYACFQSFFCTKEFELEEHYLHSQQNRCQSWLSATTTVSSQTGSGVIFWCIFTLTKTWYDSYDN